MRVWRAIVEALETGRPAALCTVIAVDGSAPRSASTRMLVHEDGSIVGTIGGGELEHRVRAAALEALSEGRSRRFEAHLTRDLGMCCGGSVEVFIEPLHADPHLHVFGAGHVAAPTCELARRVGFQVTVYDEREEWLTPERFPGCELRLGDPLRALPETGPSDYILILTHSHQVDQQLLHALIDRRWAYLGMIGSRAKVAKFFVRLRAAGVDESRFGLVSAPVGLDIGAETPEELAVAIVAELVRVRRGRAAQPRAMSEIPLPARGGDGLAVPPRLREVGTVERPPRSER